MTGFEPLMSGIGSNRSTNCATTIAQTQVLWNRTFDGRWSVTRQSKFVHIGSYPSGHPLKTFYPADGTTTTPQLSN